MQKEEAINIYKSFASMKKLPIIASLAAMIAGLIIFFLNINAGLLFIYIDLIFTGLCALCSLICFDYAILKVLKLFQKVSEVLNEDLDQEEYLQLTEAIVSYGKNSKPVWMQKPLYSAFQFQYISALVVNGMIVQAKEYLSQNGIRTKYFYNLAQVYIGLAEARSIGDNEKYIKIYESAPKAYKRVKIHSFVALIVQGKYDEVIDDLVNYTPKNKRDAVQRHMLLGEAYLKKGLVSEAKSHIEYVINIGKPLRELCRAEELYKEL